MSFLDELVLLFIYFFLIQEILLSENPPNNGAADGEESPVEESWNEEVWNEKKEWACRDSNTQIRMKKLQMEILLLIQFCIVPQ